MLIAHQTESWQRLKRVCDWCWCCGNGSRLLRARPDIYSDRAVLGVVCWLHLLSLPAQRRSCIQQLLPAVLAILQLGHFRVPACVHERHPLVLDRGVYGGLLLLLTCWHTHHIVLMFACTGLRHSMC